MSFRGREDVLFNSSNSRSTDDQNTTMKKEYDVFQMIRSLADVSATYVCYLGGFSSVVFWDALTDIGVSIDSLHLSHCGHCG